MNIVDRVKAALAAHPDNQDLKLLVSGWQEARNRYAKDKSAANRKEWRAAEKDLSLMLDELPEPQAEGEARRELPDPLPNLRQVWLYLRQLGYSCSASQPARAVKENKLSARKGGGFTQAEVRRYATVHKLKRLPVTETIADDRPAAPGAEAQDQGGAAAEKVFQQARLARIQADKMELALEKERGNLVPAADQAITLASFAAVVENELKNSLRAQAGKLITMVEGNAQRRAVLARALMDAVDGGLRHAAEIEEYRVQFESLAAPRA